MGPVNKHIWVSWANKRCINSIEVCSIYFSIFLMRLKKDVTPWWWCLTERVFISEEELVAVVGND